MARILGTIASSYFPEPVFTQALTTGGNGPSSDYTSTFIYSFADDTYTQKTSRLYNGAEGSASGYYDGSNGGDAGVYSWGGGYDNSFGSNQVYSISGNSWSAKSFMSAGLVDQTYVTYDKKFWTFGGKRTGSNATRAEVYVYDPSTNAWTQKADMPAARGIGASGVVGTKAYFIGGYFNAGPGGSSNRKNTYEYDFVNNTWSTKTDCTYAHWNPGNGGTSDGTYVYAVGGGDEPTEADRDKLERYDPSANSFTTMANIPGTGFGYDPALCTGGKIYALSSPAKVYTISSNSWTTKTGTKSVAIGRQSGALIP